MGELGGFRRGLGRCGLALMAFLWAVRVDSEAVRVCLTAMCFLSLLQININMSKNKPNFASFLLYSFHFSQFD